MTNSYLPPIISNELGSSMSRAAADRNFYSRGAHSQTLFEIDGVPISDLAKKYGSPLFVFSEADLRKKARRMREAFKSRYPQVEFAWSYKTNYLNAVCQVFHQEGWLAEVVSDFEYEKARNLGVKGKDIIFNSPINSPEIIKQAIKERALIQIENWDELALVEKFTKKQKGKPLNVGIRIWFDAGVKPVWSKFGFALENGEAERVAKRIVTNPNLNLHTFHSHIGTYILAPNAYSIAAHKLLSLREQIYMDHKHLVECLNLGGGFPSYSLLHGMAALGSAENVIEPIEAYADAIANTLNKLPEDKRPLLRLESGRCLVDESGYLLTTVVALKGVSRPMAASSDMSAYEHKEQMIIGEDAKVSYVVDAGVNLLYTAAWFKINVFPSKTINQPPSPSRLYGPLCMAIDVIRDNVDLPPLNVGDTLTLHPVGAYNVSQSMQFINYRPTIVMINQKGKPEIIRKHETLEDINRQEVLPPHLTKK